MDEWQQQSLEKLRKSEKGYNPIYYTLKERDLNLKKVLGGEKPYQILGIFDYDVYYLQNISLAKFLGCSVLEVQKMDLSEFYNYMYIYNKIHEKSKVKK